MNDVEIDATEDEVAELVLRVASGETSKAEIAVLLKSNAQST